MPDSLIRQVALVAESKQVTASDLAKVSAALQKQATRDVTQFWDIKATVDAFPKLEDVPVGSWPIMIMDDIDKANAAGVHQDNDGQPFALVTASAEVSEWSLTASHEMLEMLVDPFGNRLVAADSPKEDQGRVQILVEVCDPSESASFAYTVNGITVSDFYSPHFFDPVAAPGVRYSFSGAIKQPRQVLLGGYMSWQDTTSGEWWQEVWFDTDEPVFRSLGALTGQGSLRSQIDRKTSPPLQRRVALAKDMPAAGLPVAVLDRASTTRAETLRLHIRSITAAASSDSKALGPERRKEKRRAAAGDKRAPVSRLRRVPSLMD